MINKPQLTVSGYRGIWGESLTEDIVINYTKAFVQFVKENINQNPIILLGCDGRESGPKIKKIITKTFNNLGVRFIDGDILPTPTVLYAVRNHKYDGAIIITASHNPREYNGLKFVNNKALFTDEKEVEIIKNNFENIVNKLHQDISPEYSESTQKTLLGFCSARLDSLRRGFYKENPVSIY
jgi:phosphomannomutase